MFMLKIYPFRKLICYKKKKNIHNILLIYVTKIIIKIKITYKYIIQYYNNNTR